MPLLRLLVKLASVASATNTHSSFKMVRERSGRCSTSGVLLWGGVFLPARWWIHTIPQGKENGVREQSAGTSEASAGLNLGHHGHRFLELGLMASSRPMAVGKSSKSMQAIAGSSSLGLQSSQLQGFAVHAFGVGTPHSYKSTVLSTFILELIILRQQLELA